MTILNTILNKYRITERKKFYVKYFSRKSCKPEHSSRMCMNVSGSPQQSPVDRQQVRVCEAVVTNLQSASNCGIMVGDIFTMSDSTNGGVDGMKFVTLAAVPNILPLGQTELIDMRDKFM